MNIIRKRRSRERAPLVCALSAAVLALCSASSASAANRTVCFRLMLKDNARIQCPQAGAGVKRPCQRDWNTPDLVATDYDYMIGHVIRLFDKDPGGVSQDDYIGTWKIGGEGVQCATFPWENVWGGGEPEADGPDVYLVIDNEVSASWSDFSTRINVVKDDLVEWPSIFFRGSSDTANALVAVNCGASAACSIANRDLIAPFSSVTSGAARALLAVDSAQRVLEVWHDQFDDGTIKMEIDTNGDEGSNFVWIDHFRVTGGDAELSGLVATHEPGHVLLAQLFELGEGAQGSPNSDMNGQGWWVYSVEFQSNAIAEGWAEYVAVRAWWDPENLNSLPVFDGNEYEDPQLRDPDCNGLDCCPRGVTTCANGTGCTVNHRFAGQVVKALWDLDDKHNEDGVGPVIGYADRADIDSAAIANGWDLFPHGTGNHQTSEYAQDDGEPNIPADPEAVNLWDYQFNTGFDITTLLYHNCMFLQTQN